MKYINIFKVKKWKIWLTFLLSFSVTFVFIYMLLEDLSIAFWIGLAGMVIIPAGIVVASFGLWQFTTAEGMKLMGEQIAQRKLDKEERRFNRMLRRSRNRW